MHLLIIVAAVAAVFFAWHVLRGMDRTVRRRLGRWLGWSLASIVLFVLLFRFRAYWLAAGGAALVAIFKRGIPWLMKLLPVAHGFWSRRRAQRGAPNDQSRDSSSTRPPTRESTRMSRDEALEVLGLAGSPSSEQICSAHRELIKRVHPDRPGGSTYLTRKLNQARDVLL